MTATPSDTSALAGALARELAEQDDPFREVPEATPRGSRSPLCVAIATDDDFDGVYFAVQSLRLAHPDLGDDLSFLVADMHPQGPAAAELKGLDSKVPHLRYVPFRTGRQRSWRDAAVREADADADIVLWLQSGVLLEPAAVPAVLDHFAANPDALDLVVGADGDPAVFACRGTSWPRLDPRICGAVGDEEHLRQAVESSGGRVVALPGLRWVRRPPLVARDPSERERLAVARNRLISGDKNSSDPRASAQLANPFAFFDAILCRSMDDKRDRWTRIQRSFETLDIAWHVERFPGLRAARAPHHRGCALSGRQMVAEAHHRGLRNFLFMEDDALFLDTTLDVVAHALDDLRGRDWDLLYLGGAVHGQTFPFAEGSSVLQVPNGVTCNHSVVINHTAFERILDEMPPIEDDTFDEWIATFHAFDQYLPRRVRDGVFTAFITWPRVVTQPELRNYDQFDRALADRYTI